MTKTILYNSGNRLAEMIKCHPNLLLMLSHFNIPLGFGDQTVAQVCGEHGIDPQFFLLMCNVYAFDAYLPTIHDIASLDMSLLVNYLKSSHLYYLNKRLPHIEHHIGHIAQLLPVKVQAVFMKFFKGYCNAIEAHFVQEEEHIFPLISCPEQEAQERQLGGVERFAMSHGPLQDQLDDLMQIIFKYLPANATTDDSIDVVFDLLQLSQDLVKHNVIEEKILIPYVKLLTGKEK